MTLDEFRAISRELLSDTWGEKHYGTGVMSKLWAMVRPINAGEYRHALDELSLTVTRAPTLGQIRTACLPALRKAQEHERGRQLATLQTAEAPCKRCGNSGLIRALLRSDPTLEFSFVCPYCPAAATRGFRRIPVWTDELRETYAPVGATTEGFMAAADAMRQAFGAEAAKNRKTKEAVSDVLAGLGIEPPPF